MEDPKTTILNLLKTAFAVFKIDGETPAVVDVTFEFPEEDLSKRFQSKDILITIGREGEIEKRLGLGGDVPRLFKGSYRIGVWVKDKPDEIDESVCLASVEKIKEICRTFEKSPGGDLSRIRHLNVHDDDRVGSPMLYHRIVMVETWHFWRNE
jgi:hypothetical protein